MDASVYGPTVVALLEGLPLAPLDMGQPIAKNHAALKTLTPEKLFGPSGRPIKDHLMAQCCLAGLWLRHNFFEESHTISQEIETPTGGFWHAILHRREPDYGNARYWFRRVGQHPIFSELNDAAAAVGWPATPQWDAYQFIDRVEQSSKLPADHATRQLCIKIQQIEWELLFDYCWQHTLA